MKFALSACSDPQTAWLRQSLPKFTEALHEGGYDLDTRLLDVMETSRRYETSNGRIWRFAPEARAQLLNDLYADDSVDAILDISGGDLANETLELIDWDILSANAKPFAGFSDLSTIVVAINTITGQKTTLWNPKTVLERGTDDLARLLSGERILPELHAVGSFGAGTAQDSHEEGNYGVIAGSVGDSLGQPNDLPEAAIIGGNIRCFAKLAGTRYWPASMQGKLALLEAIGPGLEASASYMTQLRQLGFFDGAEGLILGQFTSIDGDDDREALYEAAAEITGLPLWSAPGVGHSRDSEPVTIG